MSEALSYKARLKRVTEINVLELSEAFEIDERRFGRRLIALLARWPAYQLAQSILKFDRLIETEGMGAAGQYMLNLHTQDVQITGLEHVPAEGAVLFLSNHPGIMDSIALLSYIPRTDLRILARERELLVEMPETSKRLIFLSEDNKARFKAMQQAVRHLKGGGAVLTFPAGQIEPDPAIFPADAEAALENWTESLSMFAHLGSNPTFVPIIVKGVFSKRALNSRWAKRRKTRADQEWLAAFLQVIWPPYRDVVIHVHFGEPIMAETLRQQPDTEALLEYIREQVKPMLKN